MICVDNVYLEALGLERLGLRGGEGNGPTYPSCSSRDEKRGPRELVNLLDLRHDRRVVGIPTHCLGRGEVTASRLILQGGI